jgi:hypothetical protein
MSDGQAAAKLPGAGIGPKQCPRKCAAEKGQPTELIGNRAKTRDVDQGRCAPQSDESTDAELYYLT